MKKHIITIVGCIAVAIGIVGCAHTSGTVSGQDKQQEVTQHRVTQQVTIAIARDGKLTLEGRRCPPNQLGERLSGMGARKAVVQADKQASFTEVLAVLSACKAAGVEQVSLAPVK